MGKIIVIDKIINKKKILAYFFATHQYYTAVLYMYLYSANML